MHILGIVGSMRKGRNTETLVRRVVEEMERVDDSITHELVFTPDLTCRPCRVVCHEAYCSANLFQCPIDDDVMKVLAQMGKADAVILAAPHYFRGPPAGFHTMIERLQSMAFFHEAAGGSTRESPLLDKPCGLIGICEYSNPETILEYLHDASLLLKMSPIRLKSFPYLGIGAHGEIGQDDVFRPLERCEELAAALISRLNGRSI